MLFGVSDWIQDITRSSGMVRRIKIHIWKVVLGFRKSSGNFRYCTGVFLEGSGGATSGPTDPGGATWAEGV